jgi:hypothetical protein
MKWGLLAGASALAIMAGEGWFGRYRDGSFAAAFNRHSRGAWTGCRDGGEPASEPVDSSAITRDFLLYFIVPQWTAAGVADWLCHRASRIEQTTGARESLLHLLMLVEVGGNSPSRFCGYTHR